MMEVDGLIEDSFPLAGVALAGALLEADADEMLEMLSELDEEDVRAVALVFLETQHRSFVASLEKVFGDEKYVPSDLLRIRLLEGQIEILSEHMGRTARA